MITPQKMSEFEKNKIIDMFSKLNQDLTSSIIKKLQQNEDISSFTKAQMRVLTRQGGKEVFNEALNKVNGLSRAQKKAIEQLYQEILIAEYDGYKSQKQNYYATIRKEKSFLFLCENVNLYKNYIKKC